MIRHLHDRNKQRELNGTKPLYPFETQRPHTRGVKCHWEDHQAVDTFVLHVSTSCEAKAASVDSLDLRPSHLTKG